MGSALRWQLHRPDDVAARPAVRRSVGRMAPVRPLRDPRPGVAATLTPTIGATRVADETGGTRQTVPRRSMGVPSSDRQVKLFTMNAAPPK
jgi:hypothetical protein